MVPMGISFATVTRVGNLIGARDFAGAQRAGWVALGMAVAVMTVTAVGLVAGRWLLPRAYTDDLAVLAFCASILPVAGAFQVGDGVQVVGAGILRGMGRTVPAALIMFLGFYAVALPLAYLLAFRAGAGLVGIWWGLAAGLTVVALLLVLWLRRRGPASMSTGSPPHPLDPLPTLEGGKGTPPLASRDPR
jgi:MATE family multidrug resistance protein